jgi:hypothetical protein
MGFFFVIYGRRIVIYVSSMGFLMFSDGFRPTAALLCLVKKYASIYVYARREPFFFIKRANAKKFSASAGPPHRVAAGVCLF